MGETNEQYDPVSVFRYTNYRRYLADYYEWQKKVNHAFSYRYFAQKASIKSPGLFKDVISGKRNLSKAMIVRFSAGLLLSKKESDYFLNMVLFCDAKTQEDKRSYFANMMRHAESTAYKLHSKQFDYFSHWHYTAVRELLDITSDHKKYHELAAHFTPPITPVEVKEALDALLDLELIIWSEEEQRFKKVDQIVSTGYHSEQDINRMNLINFQKRMLEKGGEAYDRFPDADIDMSTLTLSVSQETYAEIKQELRDFRQKLLAMAKRDQHPERLCQINYQMFPLTRVIKEDS